MQRSNLRNIDLNLRNVKLVIELGLERCCRRQHLRNHHRHQLSATIEYHDPYTSPLRKVPPISFARNLSFRGIFPRSVPCSASRKCDRSVKLFRGRALCRWQAVFFESRVFWLQSLDVPDGGKKPWKLHDHSFDGCWDEAGLLFFGRF